MDQEIIRRPTHAGDQRIRRATPAAFLLVTVTVLWVGPISAATPVELFVAPGGKDTSAGTVDKPVGSAEAARDSIRAMKRRGPLPDGAVVTFAAGTYRLQKTFALTAEDSGTAEAPIVYSLTFALCRKMLPAATFFPRLPLASADRAAQNGAVETYPLELPPANLR